MTQSNMSLRLDESLLTEESDGGDDVKTIPRINGSMIKINLDKEISIVGKYVNTSRGETLFQASDGEYFRVIYGRNNMVPQYESKYIEIRGIPQKVNHKIKYISHCEYGNELDMKLWNKFVILAQKYPNLF